jgi:SAM-dependent methyltransferase
MSSDLVSLLACPHHGGHPLVLAPRGGDRRRTDRLGQRQLPAVRARLRDHRRCETDDESEIAAVKEREIAVRDEQVEEYDKIFTPYRNAVEPAAVPCHLDLQPHHRVPELGCGTGRFTAWLSDQCSEWVAVDFSLRSLQHLRHTLGRRGSLQLVRADVNHVPFAPDQRFDRIRSTGMPEHIPSAELRRQLLDSCARLLTADGRLVLATYNYSQEQRARGIPKEGAHPSGIYYCYQAQELQRRIVIDDPRGVRNRVIPARFLERAPKPGTIVDQLTSHTNLPRSTGHLLLAVCSPLHRD